MRKKLVMLLLLVTLMAAAACSGENAPDPDAAGLPGLSQAGSTPEPKATSVPLGAPDLNDGQAEGERIPANAVSNTGTTQGLKGTPKPVAASKPSGEFVIEDCISSIKVPEEWYTFSSEKDKIVFYSRGEGYGWLAPYEITPVKGKSETESIILDLSGATGTAELIDTREEANGTRYVFAVHRRRYAMGEVEVLAQAGIISEEEALAQEQTGLFIAYKLNSGQWWSFTIRDDIFGGDGLLDAMEFEIVFAE